MSNITDFVNVIANGACYQGTCSPIGGLQGTFGTPEYLGIVGVLLIIIIGLKMKVSPDLIFISALAMIYIVTDSIIGMVLLPEWIRWLLIIPSAVVFSMGMMKVIKHR